MEVQQEIETYEEYEIKLKGIYYEIGKDTRLAKNNKLKFQYKLLSPIGHCQGKIKWLQGEYDPLAEYK